MPNLLDMRKMVVQYSGDYGLVGETGGEPDYAKEGEVDLNSLINLGIQSLLDEEPDLLPPIRHYYTVPEGSCYVFLPRYREITSLYRLDPSDGNKLVPLSKKYDYFDLQRVYGQEWLSVPKGVPQYFTEYNLNRHSGTYKDHAHVRNLIIDPDFRDRVVVGFGETGGWVLPEIGWQFRDPGTLLPGVPIGYGIEGNASFGDLQNAVLRQFFRVEPYTSYTLTFRCHVEASKTLNVWVGHSLVLPTSYTTSGLKAISYTPQPLPSNVDSYAHMIGFGPGSPGGFMGVVWDVNLVARSANLLVMPPADKSYTLVAYGRFFPTPLTNMYDSNWLLDNHAQGVLYFTMVEWARKMGNTALVRHYQEAASTWLTARRRDLMDKRNERLLDENRLYMFADE